MIRSTGSRETGILAAEHDNQSAKELAEVLAALGYDVYPAASATEAMAVMRSAILRAAVVAVELALGEEPLLLRLSCLPAIERLVAIGPAGDGETELTARLAGASAYVARPATTEKLADALSAPVWAPGGPAMPTERW
ncbi:MAG: hypothetical protein ACYTF6_12240 [Planctomycetota bacterium]|jgi:ActR/RegA family two-component response regulator